MMVRLIIPLVFAKNTSETLKKKLQDFEDITANSENFIYFMDISQSKEVGWLFFGKTST